MARRKTSAAELLLEEARSIEVLLDDLEPPISRLEEYWLLSLELIPCVTAIESMAESTPVIDPSDPEYVRLRRQLTDLESRITQLGRESWGEE